MLITYSWNSAKPWSPAPLYTSCIQCAPDNSRSLFGCQLYEPYGFPGDHQQNAAMFQCYVHFLYLQSVFCSCVIVVFCRNTTSFVSSKSDQCSAFDAAVLCAISCYIVPRYIESIYHDKASAKPSVGAALTTINACFRQSFSCSHWSSSLSLSNYVIENGLRCFAKYCDNACVKMLFIRRYVNQWILVICYICMAKLECSWLECGSVISLRFWAKILS